MSLPEPTRSPWQAVELGQGLAGGNLNLRFAPATLPAWYAVSVWAVAAMTGPASPPGESGWSFRITMAVSTPDSTPIGAGRVPWSCPRLPRPGTLTAASPVEGQGSTGALPGMVIPVGRACSVGGDSGLNNCTIAPATTTTTTTTTDHTVRRRRNHASRGRRPWPSPPPLTAARKVAPQLGKVRLGLPAEPVAGVKRSTFTHGSLLPIERGLYGRAVRGGRGAAGGRCAPLAPSR